MKILRQNKKTNYLSVDDNKNNYRSDVLLESDVVNVGILKYDRKYYSKTYE